MKTTKRTKSVILRSNLEYIPNVYELPKLGAGHDGEVYKYNNLVLKLLKYDLEVRKTRGLMSFDKALYFQEELDLKRFTKPIDILLDENGVYTGYVMNYLEDLSNPRINKKTIKKSTGDYNVQELISSIIDLRKDFDFLSKKNIIGRDINRGSFLLTDDFLHLCDMDKYQMYVACASDLNKRNLNYVIVKLLYFEMIGFDFVSKQDRKKLIQWIKVCCNDNQFIDDLLRELSKISNEKIYDYAVNKAKSLLLK